MMSLNIALDGPSGAGKSTIAKSAAKELGFVYVDTGAMYRAIAYYCKKNGIDCEDEAAVGGVLGGLTVGLEYRDGTQIVTVNGEDVSPYIRTPEISMGASAVAKYPAVREFLLETQRSIAAKNDIIMDGRDIGTVVLPNARLKFFLTATAEERASRRFKELSEKGGDVTYEQVLADVNERDYNDTHREIAPLKQAEDARVIDSTQLTIEQVVEIIVSAAKEAQAEGKSIKPGETSKKKERPKRELMPIHPISKTHKLGFFHMLIYTIVRVIAGWVFKLHYNMTYEGLENIPKDGGNIFASNHRSYGDPVFIAIPTRVPLSYMAKEELFKQNIFFTALIKLFGAFPVVRGAGDTSVIDTAVEKLEKGRNLVIFPEGTRSKDGKVGKGKTGVALVAAVARTTIIPVGISFEGEKLCRKKHVTVRFGKPITPQELGITDTSMTSLKKVKKAVMDAITELVD